MKDVKNGRTQAITRVIVTGVLFINAVLTAKGINPIPFNEHLVGEVIAYFVSGVTLVWSWWKDNNITEKALYWQDRKEHDKVI